MVSAAWVSVGATVAAVVGYGLYGVEDGWKWMLGSAVVPCVVLLVGRHDIPESPFVAGEQGAPCRGAGRDGSRVRPRSWSLRPVKPTDKTPLATLLHGEYLKRMIFLGVFILCQVVPMYAIYTTYPADHDRLLQASGRAMRPFWARERCEPVLPGGKHAGHVLAAPLGRRSLVAHEVYPPKLMAAGLLVLGLWPTAPVTVIILAFGLYGQPFFSGGPGILYVPAEAEPNERFFPPRWRADEHATAVGIAIGVLAHRHHRGHLRDAWLALDAWGVGPVMLVAVGVVRGSACPFCRPLLQWTARDLGKSLAETSGIDG